MYILYAETPITLAATLARPREMLLALVGGGAILDYRNRQGRTSMHVAAEKGNLEALKVRFIDDLWTLAEKKFFLA